jgi:polygalacturonase
VPTPDGVANSNVLSQSTRCEPGRFAVRGPHALDIVLGCLVLLLALLLSVTSAQAAATTRWVITEHGAIGDGSTLNTKAIQTTIDECAKRGGGVVVVPKGVFLTGAIFFKPNVNLLVEKDAVLKGTTNLNDYPLVPTRWEGIERQWTAALINCFAMTNFSLAGEGTIDGSGDRWTYPQRRTASAASETDTPAPSTNSVARRGRPRLIALQNCKDVRVADLRLLNQASWGLFMVYSEDVLASNLVIRAEHFIPSSDGIDIDSCRRVRVSGCDIDVNDDCISIKSGRDEDGRRVNRPCEDLVIEKTRFGYGHGGVAMGSEVSGGIRRVEVRDCVVEAGNWAPIRFKSQPSRGGLIEDIVYRNIEIRDARQAVEFNLAWRMVPPIAPPAEVLTQVRNVRLIRITGKVGSVGSIRGLQDSPIVGVKFEDCHLTARRNLFLENTRDIDTSGLKVQISESPTQ